jgi:adenosine kinase
MSIYISGSLAYDRVMSFPGKFSDYILPDNITKLSVCFPIQNKEEKRGGTGGNIAYNLALLGERGIILASVGWDFGSYKSFLEELGLSLEGIRQIQKEFTAGAYITSDSQGNQVTSFHAAAMRLPCAYTFPKLDPEKDIAIIAPTNTGDMLAHARVYSQKGLRYIFDPGQQIADLGAEDLRAGIRDALLLISNDYELELIFKATGLDLPGLLTLTPHVLTTMGSEGTRLASRDGSLTTIPGVRIERPVDPTGAGDAYRAGLLKGLLHGLGLEDCARIGTVCASFCVEKSGTQEHHFTESSFAQRLKDTFKLELPLSFQSLPALQREEA